MASAAAYANDLHLAPIQATMPAPHQSVFTGWMLFLPPNQQRQSTEISYFFNHYHTTTVLRPFFQDHPGEPVPEENFWTLWCKGRLTETDTLTIRLGATPSGLTSAHLHHPPIFFTGRMPFLPPNQLCQSTEGHSYFFN